MDTGVKVLNGIPEKEFLELLATCCEGVFAEKMLTARPFQSLPSLFEAAKNAWASMTKGERLVAFAAHPRIGGHVNSEHSETRHAAKSGVGSLPFSSSEQSGVDGAGDDVLSALALRNDEYFEKFGFVYLVCATGKSGEEMLENLTLRLQNSRDEEIEIATKEHDKITAIRLEKLVQSERFKYTVDSIPTGQF